MKVQRSKYDTYLQYVILIVPGTNGEVKLEKKRATELGG